MNRLNLNIEKNLYQKGYELIAGVDEAGRGAWAGPLVAGAVILKKDNLRKYKKIGVNDSKILTPKKREELFFLITKEAVSWGLGIINVGTIDRIGLGKANFLAMEEAIKNLKIRPDYLLIDALKLKNVDIVSESIIGGDAKSISVAAASILAKVSRDRFLKEKDRDYPQYGFARHKGYGTKFHRQMLLKYGCCDWHRRSFKPIKKLAENRE